MAAAKIAAALPPVNGSKLAVALKVRHDGLSLLAEQRTVRQYPVGWLESVRSSLRPRTWERYE
jgi:hypothetical protein